MAHRIHLYALPGLPLSVDDLMPQPLLARCAGSLSAQGHDALVLDDASVDCLERAGGAEAAALLADSTAHAPSWVDRLSGRERHARQLLGRYRAARIEQIITAVGPDAPELALVQIQRHKDVREARTLASALRKHHPNLVIAIAGHFVNQYARMLLAGCPEFDAACCGPAEAIVSGLARCLNHRESWESVPGLVFRHGRGLAHGAGYPLPLDPWFAPAEYHPRRYPGLLDDGKIRLFTIPQTMGHVHLGHYRGGYQPRSIIVRDRRQMRQDLEQLHQLYGAEAFHVTGSHTPAELIHAFASDCLSLPFRVRYSRDAHVPALLDNPGPELARSGCESVALSLLTGSQRTLSDYYGENWTITQAERALGTLSGAGLYTLAGLTYPCPVDDHHTRAETIRLLARTRPSGVKLGAPSLVPGSRWFQQAREFGYGLALPAFGAWLAHSPLPQGRPAEAGDLPFGFLGARAHGLATQRGMLEAALAELHIERGFSAALGLMARVAGFAGREAEYVVPLESAARHLDLAALRDMIDAFNIRATASIDTVDLFRPVPVRKVVGS